MSSNLARISTEEFVEKAKTAKMQPQRGLPARPYMTKFLERFPIGTKASTLEMGAGLRDIEMLPEFDMETPKGTPEWDAQLKTVYKAICKINMASTRSDLVDIGIITPFKVVKISGGPSIATWEVIHAGEAIIKTKAYDRHVGIDMKEMRRLQYLSQSHPPNNAYEATMREMMFDLWEHSFNASKSSKQLATKMGDNLKKLIATGDATIQLKLPE
jgi:hypothetical protein